MQAGTPRIEPFRFADVLPADQADELAGDVAVKRRRPERVLGDAPAGRDAPDLDVRRSRNAGRRRQDAIDRRIGMIERHRVDALELVQIVLVGYVIAAPGDDVKWRVTDFSLPQQAAVLGDEAEVPLAILVGRLRRLKVTRIREPEGADRPELGQP